MIIYAIGLRDIKANQHLPPMFTPNIAVGLRDLADMVNDKAGTMVWQKHPEDFEIYHLFDWETDTGKIDQEHYKQLMVLSALKTN